MFVLEFKFEPLQSNYSLLLWLKGSLNWDLYDIILCLARQMYFSFKQFVLVKDLITPNIFRTLPGLNILFRNLKKNVIQYREKKSEKNR